MQIKNYFTKDVTNQLKAIAIIFVILGHLGIINRAGAWGVGIFLILSGYGIMQSFLCNGLNNFFKKRIISVILPYSIITLVWISVDYIFKNTYSKYTIITSVLGLNFKSIIDTTMWYISFILLWYIIFFIVFYIIKNMPLRILSLFIASYIIKKYLFYIFDPNVGVRLYVWQFPIGVLIGILSNIKFNIDENKIKSIAIRACVLTFILFEVFNSRAQMELFYTLSIVSISLFFISFMLLMKELNSKVLTFIGGISFELYLFEGVFINKYNFIFSNINSDIISIVAYLVVIITLSYLYSKFIKNINKMIYVK